MSYFSNSFRHISFQTKLFSGGFALRRSFGMFSGAPPNTCFAPLFQFTAESLCKHWRRLAQLQFWRQTHPSRKNTKSFLTCWNSRKGNGCLDVASRRTLTPTVHSAPCFCIHVKRTCREILCDVGVCFSFCVLACVPVCVRVCVQQSVVFVSLSFRILKCAFRTISCQILQVFSLSTY